MHLNFSCPAVSQLCSGRERKGNRGGTLSDYHGQSQQAMDHRQQSLGPKPAMPELATHDGDLHLEAVGNPSDLKALNFKVYPDGGLVVTVKDIFAKPAGAKEVIRGAARKIHS